MNGIPQRMQGYVLLRSSCTALLRSMTIQVEVPLGHREPQIPLCLKFDHHREEVSIEQTLLQDMHHLT